MKKIILLLAMGFATITANAQKIAESAVPARVKSALTQLYPTAVVTSWTNEPINNVRAEFINAGVATSVLMGPNNNFLEEANEIKASDLPKTAADFCTGKTIVKCFKVTSYTKAVTYRVKADKEYNFDKDGNSSAK
jgi:hypothetical protein